MPLLTVSTHDVPVMQLCTGATVRAGAGLTVKLGAIFRVTIVTRDTPLTEVSLGIVLTDTPSCKIEMKEILHILKTSIYMYMYVVEKLFSCKIEMKEILDILKT